MTFRMPFNQRRGKIGEQSYALICCMPLSDLEKLPKMLPGWWSMRALSLELKPAALERHKKQMPKSELQWYKWILGDFLSSSSEQS